MEDIILNKLKILVNKTNKSNDVPISCLIIQNNRIIASEYNKKYKSNDPTAHAEILAIKKACKKLKRTNLSDCILYTTMYPCEMCSALINEVRIKKVYYILKKEKNCTNTTKYEQKFDNEKEFFYNKIRDFFENKR